MSSQASPGEFLSNLERWVQLQKLVLENFKNIDEKVRNSDRLDIIIHTRIAFNHMIRTLKAFDDWLQDPFITTNIPRDVLLDVWSTTMSLFEALLKLDIRHTSQVKDLIEKAFKEGKINPIIAQLKDLASREERRGPPGPSISI
ncbi:MAG: DUF2153 domain-containing protein [Desulfurococcales archaeon]|nr:DUF2153 domain-containing protein [Desulfurococcales archaeon]MEB3780180.1 DUF2153 domain-containing protein [Desulfurococcales archaeon]